jgi:uncharacterized membrane protein (UPF0136 family)
MGLDIRLPIGLMFAILGVVLVLCGLFMDPAIYRRSLGININLWWGLVLLVFGSLMFWPGRKGSPVIKTAEESIEGLKTEEYEQAKGLEENSDS